MKKITFLFVITSFVAFAQQNTSYETTSETQQEVNTAKVEGTIVRVENNRQLSVSTYTVLADFNTGVTDNCSDATLSFEDMVGGPAAITSCGTIISTAGDGCFAAGELEAGFTAEASNATEVIYIPAGAIGNVDPLVGASTFAEFTIITFDPSVYAVAFDLWENNDPTTIVRVYGAGDVLLDTFNAITPTNQQTFFGFIADEVITKVELEGNAGSGELFGNFLFGADDCMILGVNSQILASVSLYPNPANDKVSINIPAGVSINKVALTDVLGKTQTVAVANNVIDVSSLSQGLYMISIETSEGNLVKKLIKE